MTKEHSTENFLFWKTVRQFSNNFSSDIEICTEELVEEARTIFNTFISEDSKYTLNLPAEITAELRKIFTDTFLFPKGINQWVFKPAMRAILDLISRDTYRRFKATPEGANIVKAITDKEEKRFSKK